MQAEYALSRNQILALESTYLFLLTLRPLLASLGHQLGDTSRANLDGTIKLCDLNEKRLLAEFAELQEIQARWEKR